MRFSLAIPLILPALLLAQTPSSVSIESLIAELGSASYADREKATKALMQRPDAEAAVRLASRSSNTEVSRRATVILEALLMSELKTSAKQGKLQRVMDLIASWPAGKYEQESRDVISEVAKNLTSLYIQHGGKYGLKNTPFVEEWWNQPRGMITADCFTEEIKIDRSLPPRPSRFFLRTAQAKVRGAVSLNAYNGGNGGAGNDTETFWCLFGDANNNQKVTTQDYCEFAQSYLARSNNAAYVPWFDQNGNNKVTTQDFAAFANNYLKRYSGFTATI